MKGWNAQMGWDNKGHYYRGKTRIRHWKHLRDADGKRILEAPKVLIDWFDDFLGDHPYVALSNYFCGEPFEIDGLTCPTGEHAFAVGKASTPAGVRRVLAAPTADDAKVIGRSIRLRSDWESHRLTHMRKVIRAKFARGRQEAEVLLSTGDAKLVEGTLWHDDFWGVDLEEPGRPGANHLGKVLMTRRAQLRRR